MAVSFSLVRKIPSRSEVHAIPVASDDVPAGATKNAPGVKEFGLDWAVLASRGFEGSIGQVNLVSSDNGPIIAVVGVGPAKEVDATVMRRAAGAFARAAKRHKTVSSALLDAAPEDADKGVRSALAQAHAEGMVMGAYRYDELRSEGKAKPNKIASVSVVGRGGKAVTDALERGRRVGEGVTFARDLVNEPGGSLTPPKFAQVAQKMAKREGLTVKVMDLAAIRKAKMGGVLGVNRGSYHHPRFVQITYTPTGKAAGSVALVGKGITFDAGGLSIKSGTGMMTMKMDMGGAAAVLGAMSAVKAVAPSVKVTAYVPMTDNMLGPDATRPGDVLTIRNGKTVEVLNTDAEGRLILADALSLASEAKPDAIIDLATLTGAAMAALGNKFAALMGTNDDLRQQVEAAAARAGENVWHMPLPAEYRSLLDSGVADMKNIGGNLAGALTAGLFLKEFVGEEIAWAHLDIAGPAWTDADAGLDVKGGTGFGVRTLLELVQAFEKPSADVTA